MSKPIQNDVPKRGDIVQYVDFSTDQQGNEIQKLRPVLVLSPYEYNKKYTLILCSPITSNPTKRHPLCVSVPSGLATRGTILVNQSRFFDRVARKMEIVEPLPPEVVKEVLEKILLLVQLEDD